MIYNPLKTYWAFSPPVPGGHPVLESKQMFDVLYARNKEGWYFFDQNRWVKVTNPAKTTG